MQSAVARSYARSAFTLVELIVVIVVLGILAGVAIPKYIDYSANAKAASCKGVLGGVRSAIDTFYVNASYNGAAAWPTLVQLQTDGSVLQIAQIGINPYNGSATIAAATWNATPPTSGANGWNYDVAVGKFWANTNTVGENSW